MKNEVDEKTEFVETDDMRALINIGPFNFEAGESTRFSFVFALAEQEDLNKNNASWEDLSGLKTSWEYSEYPFDQAVDGTLISKIEDAWNLYYDGKLDTEDCLNLTNIEERMNLKDLEIIYIHDYMGRTINTKKLDDLKNGAYLVTYRDRNSFYTRKILIQ